jgi:hypothetical protein
VYVCVFEIGTELNPMLSSELQSRMTALASLFYHQIPFTTTKTSTRYLLTRHPYPACPERREERNLPSVARDQAYFPPNMPILSK